MLLGRPQAIDDKTADTLPPSDVDIDVLPRFAPAPVPQPFPAASTSPSDSAPRKPPGVFRFVAIRHELAKLIGRIVEHFQDLSRPRNYADVLQIDSELQRFYAALPGYYLYSALRGDEADTSFDSVCPWLPIHRYLLNIEYNYVRNALHRPYLLRSERYKQSREATFASSKADRIVRREYEREVSWPSNKARNTHLGGVYRKFASTLIAGIELLLEPNGANAPELKEVLDDFLNSSTKVADPSQCTKRELAIIKIFKAKAMDPSWCAATATGARTAAGKANGKANGNKESSGAPQTAMQGNTAVKNPSVADGKTTATSAARLPPSQKEKNELAQTLLDRLGGLESLQVLNQNQSPGSNSATSLEFSNGQQVNANAGSLVTSQQLNGGAAASLAAQPAPPSLSSLQTSNGFGTANGETMAYTVPATFDGLFDADPTSNDWFSSYGMDPSNLGVGFGTFGNTMAATGAPTPGGSIPAKDDSDFAGWGTLVEAIVSGQDN